MTSTYTKQQFEDLVGSVSRETWNDLHRFENLLQKWSNTFNFVAPTEQENLWNRHIVDSAQLILHARNPKSWIDVGSGGGFPGLIVAILLKAHGDMSMVLIESNNKKAAFLQTVATELALPVKVIKSRIERVTDEVGAPDIISARAVAPLNKLLELTEAWLSNSSVALFHKGRDCQREIDESAKRWSYNLVKHPSVIANDSVILEVSNLRRRS